MRLSLSVRPSLSRPGRLLSATALVAGLASTAVGAATTVAAAPSRAASTHSQHHAQVEMSHKLHRLRGCESGDRYHVNSGNGYYGAYQFADSTWHSLGYHGRPDRAAPQTQDAAARKLHGRSGWHPWPVCSKREHLYSH